jgi:hypothetical protein
MVCTRSVQKCIMVEFRWQTFKACKLSQRISSAIVMLENNGCFCELQRVIDYSAG